MRYTITILFVSISCLLFAQDIPYNNLPDWESEPEGRISTGLGLADINGDGWKDMIVADGNDIQRQHLTVHYNNGDGSFNSTPDWESLDIDYHGHLAVGDLNNDGWPDVAVSVYIGPSGFSDPGKLKIYYNTGGQLENSPSFESMPFYTFSCALGDADGDGDLDIGVACGEPYSSILDQGRIYLNENGTFSDDNIWESDISMGSLDVEFGDIDLNGYLDIIFTCEDTPNYIYFADESGQIESSPSWVSTDADNYINSVDVGYDLFEGPKSYLLMTGNDQLGGDGRVKKYVFDTEPYETTPVWESNPFGYGSGIILYSVFWETQPDLIYGGWWRPMKIALKTTGEAYELNTSYTSSTNSVVEAILVSDLGKESMLDTLYILNEAQAGNTLILPHQVVEHVSGVSVEDVALSSEMFKHVPGKNWLIIDDEIPLNPPIAVHYQYSPHGDIAISNWDTGKGNYIFYNTNEPVGIMEQKPATTLCLYPNPADDEININLGNTSNEGMLQVFDQAGQIVMQYEVLNMHKISIDVHAFSNGLYFVLFRNTQCSFYGKFAVIH